MRDAALTANPILRALPMAPRTLAIVDIGAAFLGEKQFYQPLLDCGIGRLASFEPERAKYEELATALAGDDAHMVLNCALGDGARHTLRPAAGGMTSLLAPDPASYGLFTLFAAPPHSPLAASGGEEIATQRLDDVEGLAPIDFLKIDTQGSELMILQNGRAKLGDCAILQIEMPFVCLYKDQPTYGDIDAELRAQDFMVHGFATLKRLPLAPYAAQGPLAGINQLVDLDMVYVRDLRRMDRIPDRVLKNTAVAGDLSYASFDLALRCLTELETRGAVETGAAQRYARDCAGRQRTGYIHHTPYVG